MADNVIIQGPDGSKDVYKNVSEVELATEDGGTAVFVHTDDVTAVEQKQADMAQTDPTAVDFVKNQYFGVLPDNVKEKEFTFEPNRADNFGYRAIDFVLEAPIVIGQTYVVTWDGVEHVLVAKDTADIETGLGVTPMSAPYLGNSSFVGYAWGEPDWGEDTGEPFLINPGSSGSSGSSDSCCTNDTSVTTHTVGIRPANREKKLDAKWLPDNFGGGVSSWNDLTDKPFGGENIHIVVDHSQVDTNIMFSVPELDMTLVKLSSETLSKDDLIGATFEATFPGGETESAVVSETDLQIEYDKGFCYLVMGQVPVWVCLEAGEHTISKDGQSSTFNVPEVGCYVADFAVEQLESSQITKNSIKYLDNKYLDFMGKTELSRQEFLPETTSITDYFTEFGAFGFTVLLDEDMYNTWNENINPVIVRYDGAEHILNPQLIDPFQSGYTTVGVGNLDAFGGVGNGEPFAIATSWEEIDGGKIYVLLIGSTVDTTPIEHTVTVYLQVGTQKIKPEYIPDSVKLPTFTAEDEGKVLRIVNGVPQWVSLST